MIEDLGGSVPVGSVGHGPEAVDRVHVEGESMPIMRPTAGTVDYTDTGGCCARVLGLAMQTQRTHRFRRAAWGRMAERPVPQEVMDGWLVPARRDAAVTLSEFVAAQATGAGR